MDSSAFGRWPLGGLAWLLAIIFFSGAMCGGCCGYVFSQPPPGSLPPGGTGVQSDAQKQLDLDRTTAQNAQISYDSLILRMHQVNRDVFDLNRVLQPPPGFQPPDGPNVDTIKRALKRANAKSQVATAALVKANYDVYTMGAQLLSIEKSAFFFGDFQVSLVIGQVSKPYWSDAQTQLSAANGALSDAEKQIAVVQRILSPSDGGSPTNGQSIVGPSPPVADPGPSSPPPGP